jgi:hypothetical protein
MSHSSGPNAAPAGGVHGAVYALRLSINRTTIDTTHRPLLGRMHGFLV